ncbi:hypothetical protein L1469_004368 [Escherichia coli]|nr:hypothetical protein [Escherichia coli]ELX9482886.1 hypothetical protein [Escherichia coli]HAH8492562.1 hypothetical protein [Escherichia coli]HAL6710442.1 hypothetical protein [Escherichia coli]HDQ4267872.1 hypothetical protein [Escherichia coli]
MHTTSRNILRLINSVVVVLISAHGYCDTDVTYQHIMGKTTPITLENYIGKPSSSTEEVMLKQHDFKVHITLSVKQVEQNILATIRFTNFGKENYFIHRRLIPIQPRLDEPYFFSPLCQNAFSITTNNIYLRFRPTATNICGFVEDDDDDELYFDINNDCDIKSEWINFSPGDTNVFTLNLNDAYSFLPGVHWYKIKTLEYRIASEKWFFQRSTNKMFFSIVDFHYPSCLFPSTGARKLSGVCEYVPSAQEGSMSYFLLNFFPGGGKNYHYIDAASNEVRIKIDGGEVKSYDETKIELLKRRYGTQWEEYRY